MRSTPKKKVKPCQIAAKSLVARCPGKSCIGHTQCLELNDELKNPECRLMENPKCVHIYIYVSIYYTNETCV